jgi:hypothetical protein
MKLTSCKTEGCTGLAIDSFGICVACQSDRPTRRTTLTRVKVPTAATPSRARQVDAMVMVTLPGWLAIGALIVGLALAGRGEAETAKISAQADRESVAIGRQMLGDMGDRSAALHADEDSGR